MHPFRVLPTWRSPTMEPWKTTLTVSRTSVKILATDPRGNECLKARLPLPNHPRALTTLCEGLALWGHAPLHVVIAAGSTLDRSEFSALFGENFWLPDSALVHFDLALPVVRRRTLPGLGDFRQLRLLLRRSR